MPITKQVYVYQLLLNGEVLDTVIVDDPSDTGCIGGKDANGVYHQYDSYELWHAYEWATDRGFVLRRCVKTITISDSDFEV